MSSIYVPGIQDILTDQNLRLELRLTKQYNLSELCPEFKVGYVSYPRLPIPGFLATSGVLRVVEHSILRTCNYLLRAS